MTPFGQHPKIIVSWVVIILFGVICFVFVKNDIVTNRKTEMKRREELRIQLVRAVLAEEAGEWGSQSKDPSG